MKTRQFRDAWKNFYDEEDRKGNKMIRWYEKPTRCLNAEEQKERTKHIIKDMDNYSDKMIDLTIKRMKGGK